jgi:hypothetical protein
MNDPNQNQPWPEVLNAEESERFIGGPFMMKIAKQLGLEPLIIGNRFTRYHIADLRAFINKIKVEKIGSRRRGVTSKNPSLSAYR